MGKIDTLEANLKSINISTLFNSIMKELREWIIDQNVQEQLYEKGIDARGERLEPPYAVQTIKYKTVKGQPVDRVTLRDEGDFHASFGVEYKTNEVEIIARDPKTPKLMSKYGADILGLTDENIDELIQKDIKPRLLEEIRNIILK